MSEVTNEGGTIIDYYREYKFVHESKELPRVDWQRSMFFFAKDPYFVTISKYRR